MIAEIPRTGLCIGEVIPLSVTVENGSSQQIRVSVTLEKITTFCPRGNHDKRTLESVVLLTSGLMQARNSSVWRPENELRVPSGFEPISSLCDIIAVEYILLVTAVIPWAINPSIRILSR